MSPKAQMTVKDKPQRDRETQSDLELFEEIAKKQARAFSILYNRYSPMLFGLAVKILRDRALAEDVLQETFLQIWNKAEKFNQSRGKPAAWMTILCRNKCIDKLRSIESGKHRSATLDEELMTRSTSVESEDPFDFASRGSLQSLVAGALNTLPEEQKQLIEMAYFGGFSQSEIARELGLPLGTVKTRIRLGMQKLKILLSERMT